MSTKPRPDHDINEAIERTPYLVCRKFLDENDIADTDDKKPDCDTDKVEFEFMSEESKALIDYGRLTFWRGDRGQLLENYNTELLKYLAIITAHQARFEAAFEKLSENCKPSGTSQLFVKLMLMHGLLAHHYRNECITARHFEIPTDIAQHPCFDQQAEELITSFLLSSQDYHPGLDEGRGLLMANKLNAALPDADQAATSLSNNPSALYGVSRNTNHRNDAAASNVEGDTRDYNP